MLSLRRRDTVTDMYARTDETHKQDLYSRKCLKNVVEQVVVSWSHLLLRHKYSAAMNAM